MARLTKQQLEDLYVRYAPVVHRRAFALLNHETDAWEVVRDVFERMREVPDPKWVYDATMRAALRAMRAPTHPVGLRLFELAGTIDREQLPQAAAELIDGAPQPPHATQLELDGGKSAHVEACPECTARSSAITAARAASEKSAGYARVKAQVVRERPARWRELMPFIVPVVFTIVCFGVISIDLGGPKPPAEIASGGRISVAADAGLHAVVLTVDKDRRIEELYSGAVPAGGLDLPAPAGPLAVHAFISSQPLDTKALVPALEGSVREYGGYPLEAPAPTPDGVTVITRRLR